MVLMPMVLDIALHHRCRHGIPHRPNQIPILPKFLLPQMLLQLRILSKYLTGRNTFQNPYLFGNRIPGRKIQKNMHMLLDHIQLDQLKAKVLSNLAQHLFNTSSDILPNDPSPLFRCPDQMIFCVVNRTTDSANGHGPMVVSQPRSASGRLNFSSPSKSGASKFVLVNRE